MPYLTDDPRSALAAPADPVPQPPDGARSVRYIEERQLRGGVVRGQNCAVWWSDVEDSEVLVRDNPDEYLLLLLDESPEVRIEAAGEQVSVSERAVVIVPGGPSVIEAAGSGSLVRIFTSRCHDVFGRAVNARDYEVADPRCTLIPEQTGPCPSSLRVHLLRDHPVRDGVFGRIFRTADLMINVLADEPTPRDPRRLSPHHHDDFEQLSLGVQGDFIHHLRYPWGPDSTIWREDEHREVGSPSLTVIPPPVVHTTQGVGPSQKLVDIFSPPRGDFGAKSGWVRNASEYPA